MTQDTIIRTSDQADQIAAMQQLRDVNLPLETVFGNYSGRLVYLRRLFCMIKREKRSLARLLVEQERQRSIQAGLQGVEPTVKASMTVSSSTIRRDLSYLRYLPVFSDIQSLETGVVLFDGAGRSGKTTTMYEFKRTVFPARRCALYRFPARLVQYLNEHDRNVYYFVDSLDDVENGDICIIDDTIAYFDSLDTHKDANKDVRKWTTYISHKKILLFLTAQNTSSVLNAFFQHQELILIQKCKHGQVGQYAKAREQLREALVYGYLALSTLAEEYPSLDWRGLSVLHFRGALCVFRSDMPPWYNDDLSRAMRDVSIEDLGGGGFNR